MKLLAGTLYCEFSDLLSWGVSEAYLWKVCSQARAGGKSWANIKEGGRVLIDYDTIPTATINSKGIPAKAALLAQLKAQELAKHEAARDTRSVTLLSLLPAVSKADIEALRAARIGRDMADVATGEVRKREETGLPLDKLRELTEVCRWLALLSDSRWKSKPNRQKLGFDTLKELQEAMVEAAAEVSVKLPTNYSKLQAKLREYKTEGAAAVIPATFGRQNARKVTEDMLEWLIAAYADKSKPDFSKVWGWYEQARIRRTELGLGMWPELSVSAVKQNLLAHDVMPAWYLGRHGVAAWRAKFEYTVQRFRPSFRDALWVIDGTKVNYFYRHPATGMPSAKLTVVAVVDAHSEMVLGWAFVEGAEDGDTSRAAIRLACERAGGILPVQMQSDNGGANKGLATAWEAAGAGHWTLAQPHNGQSKIIESIFGRIQDQVMRGNDAFTGQNITAKSLESAANPELMDALKGKLWTMEEVLAQTERDLLSWNHLRQKKDGKTPAERYAASQHPEEMRVLTSEDEAALFWNWNGQTVQHRRDGLKLTHRNRTYHYEVVDAAGVPDADFLGRWGTADFWVKFDPAQPGAALALYTGADRRFVALAITKRALPMALADRVAGDGALINTRLGVKGSQQAAARERLTDAQQHVSEAEGDVRLHYSWFDKEAQLKAEDEYLTRRFGPASTTAEPATEAPAEALVLVEAASSTDALAAAKYAKFLRMQQEQDQSLNT